MKIQSSTPNNLNPVKTDSTSKAAETSKTEQLKKMKESDQNAKSRTIEDSTKTDISPKAKEFAKALTVAASTPDIREDRVADLKKRISEGTYKVDAEAVADKMISEHMSM